MKFGFLLPNYGPTASFESIADSAQLAEKSGFDSVWSTDHIIVPKRESVPYGNLIESIVSLSIAACVTSRVKLGTSIIVLPQREPIVLAKQLACLDRISGGRLIFGAGAGWLQEEFEFLGADFNNRGKFFEEYIQVIRTLWRGKSSYNGRYVSFDDALFSPLPPQGDNLPIWIAGNSPTAIKRAAMIGDAWHPVGLTPKELVGGLENLRSVSEGRKVMATLRTNIQLPGMGGMKDQASESSLNKWHNLKGNLELIHRDLMNFEEAGLEYLVLWFFHNDWNELESSLTIFAQEIMPSFVQ
jgi:probable F420-dependent oxidoreductase